jgi:hypothetical protein
MKQILLVTLLAFAVVGGSVALVRSQTVCPPGQHLSTSGGKFGDKCYPNRAGGPAAPAATTCAVRHRVCKPDGSCAMVCN